MRVDDDARGSLAGPVQPFGVRRSDVDPREERAGEVADRDRRVIRLRDPFRKPDALGVFKTIGKQPSDEMLLRWAANGWSDPMLTLQNVRAFAARFGVIEYDWPRSRITLYRLR